jgi:NMT1/THI5 like.
MDKNAGAKVIGIMMVYDAPPFAIIGRKSLGVSKPKDLEGKILGAPAPDGAYAQSFQHTGLAVVLQGLVRPRLRGTELEFWRNSEEARTDRPSQQLRSLNGEWRLMRYFLLTHLCGISHRIWCTLSTICSDAA